MRVIGLLLVMIGGLVLGYQGLNSARPGADATPAPERATDSISSVPPVASGIVVVSGLLLLASARRSED
ncbi:hypothetical protein FTUN_6608 [Frigoriglobus tundricola]|uniref:DUF3185 domain-containing protein n=1 Tax=Frigoriglobus tundricola TaxID=2774151 RepID=A0A6M5Z1F7_9BACT|nr:hypothetical protein FTUN_6608 [Frigoriglobus tundricola]